jgi:hypothetical protein
MNIPLAPVHRISVALGSQNTNPPLTRLHMRFSVDLSPRV